MCNSMWIVFSDKKFHDLILKIRAYPFSEAYRLIIRINVIFWIFKVSLEFRNFLESSFTTYRHLFRVSVSRIWFA